MKPRELLDACDRAIESGALLRLAVPWVATGERVRLFRTAGPTSEPILCVNSEGHTVAQWDPIKVKTWIVSQFAAAGIGGDA